MAGAPQPRKPIATFSIVLPPMTVVRGPMPTVVAGDYNLPPAMIIVHSSTPPWVEHPPEVSYATYARLRKR